MTARLKVHFLEEAELGQLPAELKKRWDDLVELTSQLESLQDKLETTTQSFFQSVRGGMDILPDHSREQPELEITPDGQVFQKFCVCPLCQARIQQLPVNAVIDALVAEGSMDADAARAVRTLAGEEQAATDAETKRRMLLN